MEGPNVTTRPGLGRAQTGSGDCSLHIITDPFCDCAWSKENNLRTPSIAGTENRRRWYGECYCSNCFVKCWLQKGLIPRPDKNDTSDIGTGLGLRPEFRPIAISTICRTAQSLVRYLSSSQSTTKICAKNVLTLLVAGGGLFLSTPRVFLKYLPNGLS